MEIATLNPTPYLRTQSAMTELENKGNRVNYKAK